MANHKKVIQDLLGQAGISVNGKDPWDITVNDDEFYDRLVTNTELALGETYMDKRWDCSSLDQFFYRILKAKLGQKAQRSIAFWRSYLSQYCVEMLRAAFNPQSVSRVHMTGSHYNKGNDLFEKMLDKRMVYTCAYWENAKNLDEAQENKLKLSCQKLRLEPGMTVLDIGCGWGSFAKYAVENHDVRVVGITISEEQCELAKARCAGLPIEIKLVDYRELLKRDDRFDRIVSLGMFEHVGCKNYAKYMQTAAHCLKPNGLFLLHTIGAHSSRIGTNRWIDTYIFPNGQLPTLGQIERAMEGLFIIDHVQNIGIHYDKTLMAWYDNFNNHWPELSHKYDERFRRMWNYYLLSCAASFRARQNQVWQLLLSKNS